MKYLVNVAYQLDESKTFIYDRECKSFVNLILQTGIIFTIDSGLLPDLYTAFMQLVTSFGYRNKFINTLVDSSFNVLVYELHGINDNAPNAIVITDYIPSDSTQVYNGPLSGLTT